MDTTVRLEVKYCVGVTERVVIIGTLRCADVDGLTVDRGFDRIRIPWRKVLRVKHFERADAIADRIVVGDQKCREYITNLANNIVKAPNMNDFLMPAPCPVPSPVVAQSGPARIAAMEAALAAEIVEQDEAAQVAVKRQAVAADLALVNAQGALLHCIDVMLKGQPYTQPTSELAKHAKALKPMAEAHGFKIVLVGDKSLATVVVI